MAGPPKGVRRAPFSQDPEYAREGLRIVLKPIPGLTSDALEFPFAFQVPPMDEWGIDYAHAHTRYSTIRRGEYSRRGGRSLRTSSWSTLVVDSALDDRGAPTPSFVTLREEIEIEDMTYRLTRICESGTPFLYTAEHPNPPGGFRDRGLSLAGPEAQWPAVLERLSVREKAGEGDSRYFAMEFTEYRDPVTDRQQHGKRRTGGRTFPAHAIIQKDGTAKEASGKPIGSGADATLAQLARHYYRDPSMARAIANANNLRSFGPSDRLITHARIKAGSKLTIPKPAVASINPPG